MNILITGDKGFIGSRLTKRLKDDGRADLITGYDLKKGFNILDTRQLDKILNTNRYDAIIHLAAKTSVEESHRLRNEYFETNFFGTLNVINAANKHNIKRIIYAATAASLYPDSSPYASSKLSGEQWLRLFKGKSFTLRLFNVVGRRSNPNYCGVIDAFRNGIKKGEIIIYGDGKQTRDFVHIDDVCDAFIEACFSSRPGTYKIGSGRKMSINNLAKTMIGNKQVRIVHEDARKEVRNSLANIAAAKKYLKFRPNHNISEFFE